MACWAVPGAAFSLLAIAGQAGSGPFPLGWPGWVNGPVFWVLAMLFVVCAAFWLSLPVTLLVVGLGQLRFVSPSDWRWPVLWAGAILDGLALDVLVVRALDPNAPVPLVERELLVAAVGFLAVGAAMIVILKAARRALPGMWP